MVPVVDLSRRGSRFAERFAAAADRIARTGSFLLGPELQAFEAELAAWAGAAYVCAVGSGAAALQLTLAALGIGPGDEVIVPAFTAVPTASAVAAVGAVPIAVDVDARTACIDSAAIEPARTPRTKAVIVVHLYGFPAPLPQTELLVVDDAAQAQGAFDAPRHSAATAFSFYPTKNLGGIGDGGAVLTEDGAVDAGIRRLRVHGMTTQYVHEDISQNFRMSEIDAAWLRIGLADLDADIVRRRQIAAVYRQAAPQLSWQSTDPLHAYHLCVFRTTDRDRVRAQLAERGVATAVHYPLAITQQPAYRHFPHEPCPEAERWAAECVSVPCFPELSDSEVSCVAAALATVAR